MSYEHEARLNRIVNFSFDRRAPVVRFRENNIIFYSMISNAENELLEWRYGAVLDKEFNTAIVLVLNHSNEPINQANEIIEQRINLFNYLD
jgi:hypothetical protein